MSKKKLGGLAFLLIGSVVAAAMQSGLLPNICPKTEAVAPVAPPAAPNVSELLDAGAQ